LHRVEPQPNNGWAAVRRWMAARGWVVEHEAMVEDRRHFYVVLGVRPHAGPAPDWSEDELRLGPHLLRRRSPSFQAWLHHELRRAERALQRAGGRAAAGDLGVEALRAHAARLRRALATSAS
ncbi:MAG: tRNA (adenine(22)-N(1))-methyltransferase TrmK, partial [Myxococcales bacterium]|nr:tRNA (adenine(22)-N(1))-methyltransferase TrmK [Myxococcales bacterium]